MLKSSIHQADIAIKDVQMSKNRGTKYMKQNLTELKREIDNSTVWGGDFNTSFSMTYRTARQKINKERENLNNTINQLVLRHFLEQSTKQQQNICSLQEYIDYFPELTIYQFIQSYETNLSKFKRTDIIKNVCQSVDLNQK